MKSGNELQKFLRGCLKPTSRLSVSRWADEYQVLPSDSAEPGRYKTARVPYMREVMDAFTDGAIGRVTVKSAAQCGKSAVLLNVVGRYAHLAPANVMIIQPTLEVAMDFSKTRLSTMIRDCKPLTPLFYDKVRTRDANQTILSKFFKGGRVILVGANSPAGLASRPIKILLCDEVDRYPPSASSEGDPISIAEKRTTTFFDKKIGIFSTPTVKGSSRIDIEYETGTQEEWSHQCPNCGSRYVLDYRDMIVSADIKKDEAGAKSVTVSKVQWCCPACGKEFTELQMRRAAQGYVMKNPAALANGFRSFFINGFTSPWLKWTDIMREWLEAKGDPMREAVVMNTRFGLSYEVPTEIEDDGKLPEGLEEYGAQLPSGVLLLTAGVDVQKDRLECAIYGWNDRECYGISYDVIKGEPQLDSTWQKLARHMSRQFRFRDGSSMKVARTFVDSGYATDYVCGFCRTRAREGFFAIKGKSIFGAPLVHKTNWLKDRELYLTTLNVDEGKSEVYALLSTDKMHFGRSDEFQQRNFDETFFKGLTSERRVKKYSSGTIRECWEPKTRHIRNEPLDITVYALAAMRSCAGIDAEKFWHEQRERLKGAETKKSPPRRLVSQLLAFSW